MARGALYTPEEIEWLRARRDMKPSDVWGLHRKAGWPQRAPRQIREILRDERVTGDVEPAPVQPSRTEKPDGTTELKSQDLREAQDWQDIMRDAGLNPDDYELIKLSLNIKPSGLTQTWVQVKPKVVTTGRLEALEGLLLEKIRLAAKTLPWHQPFIARAATTGEKKLLVLAIPDLHLGKLAWAEETGENYDIDIAASAFRNAVEDILARAGDVDQVLIPLGHDFFHIDSLIDGKVPATFKGTAQDVDGRWIKAFDVGFDLMVWAIEMAAKLAPVEVVEVPGNHDKTKSYMLAKAVQARFHNDPFIEVELGANPRKATRWGNVGLMHTHGEEKPALLAHLFQIEFPRTWGETLFREILMGHFHKKREWMDEEGGVLYNRLGSLSGADAWHHEQGYKGAVRTARGIVYGSVHGRLLDIHHNLVPDRLETEEREPVDLAA